MKRKILTKLIVAAFAIIAANVPAVEPVPFVRVPWAVDAEDSRAVRRARKRYGL